MGYFANGRYRLKANYVHCYIPSCTKTIKIGKKRSGLSLLPVAKMGNCDLKDGEGEGEIKRFILVIDCEDDGGESEGERLVVGCSKSDEAEVGKKVTGCGR